MNTNPRYSYEKTPQEIIEETKLKQETIAKGKQYKEKELVEEFSYHPSSSSCYFD